MDPLAAGSAVGDGHRASGHTEVIIGLDACGALVLGIIAVIGGSARNLDGRQATFHQHIVIGSDALFHGRSGRDRERASTELHIFVGLDSMTGLAAGAYGDRGTVHHTDIIVGNDAGLALRIVGGHFQAAAAAEDELTLGEEYPLHVFIAGCGIRCRGAVG